MQSDAPCRLTKEHASHSQAPAPEVNSESHEGQRTRLLADERHVRLAPAVEVGWEDSRSPAGEWQEEADAEVGAAAGGTFVCELVALVPEMRESARRRVTCRGLSGQARASAPSSTRDTSRRGVDTIGGRASLGAGGTPSPHADDSDEGPPADELACASSDCDSASCLVTAAIGRSALESASGWSAAL